jgi:hypothetical protein
MILPIIEPNSNSGLLNLLLLKFKYLMLLLLNKPRKTFLVTSLLKRHELKFKTFKFWAFSRNLTNSREIWLVNILPDISKIFS